MGSFQYFLSRRYEDPVLGTLVRGWGCWRGQLALGADQRVPLVLAGWRDAPDSARLALARGLMARYESLRPGIAEALFAHYAPYVDAVAAGEESAGEQFPRLTGPGEVWEHSSPVRVSVERTAGRETVEIAYRVDWDEEHTLGARIQAWELVELNGSVRG